MVRPIILVTPSQQASGVELLDPSISVGNSYLETLSQAGALPLALPLSTNRTQLAAYLERADGLLLTGGDELDPRLYWPDVSSELLAKCDCEGPIRDTMELTLLDLLFRNPKPLLAVCRGHQLVNVALGGTLYVDLPTQRTGSLDHAQMERRFEPVHQVDILPYSLAAEIWNQKRLSVNSTHHQAIQRIADPLLPSLMATDGVIEGTELRPEYTQILPWYQSVQFHPERLANSYPVHQRLFQAFVGACVSSLK